jgi:DNA-directed RNA polymerase subunit RPC12/RpoP
MNKVEYDEQNQQKCDKCGRVVGINQHGRKHECECKSRVVKKEG